MSTKSVRCCYPGCGEPAAYKLGAQWTDGVYSELKSYGHSCSEHLGVAFREAEARWRKSIPAPGESVEEVAIFRYDPGKRDKQLQRLWGLEENYRTSGNRRD